MIMDTEAVERCPACGEPIDYCGGHGEIGDPEGFDRLTAHDEGDHVRCHIDADCGHVNYPHHPGRLYDCPACEARCHCTQAVLDGTETPCIYAGVHTVNGVKFFDPPTEFSRMTS